MHFVIRREAMVGEVSPPFEGAFALINSPVGCFRQKPDFGSGEREYSGKDIGKQYTRTGWLIQPFRATGFRSGTTLG